MPEGSLVIVGVGYRPVEHTTLEVQSAMAGADKLFHLVGDKLSEICLAELNPSAESLRDSYQEGKLGLDSAYEMVERILRAVRARQKVCVALSGHPGILDYVAQEAIGRAREEKFPALMLPGVSVFDCLFAELEIDPAANGCQVFDATDFLIRRRRFDPACPLILLQAGVIGVRHYVTRNVRAAERLRVLAKVLQAFYPRQHGVVLYETQAYPVCPPRIERIPLGKLGKARVSVHSTLYVPPSGAAKPDARMVARLRREIRPRAR